MFTFGIFTTHFPYLAFVAFYAYFLLFGVNKASSGEIQISENQHKIEIYANSHFSGSINNAIHFEKAVSAHLQKANIYYSPFEQKINFPVFRNTEYRQTYFSLALFSRPPPVA
jgi:hypothetical protein